MIDERTEAQASLYALGALPPEETPEFEAAMLRDLQLQLLVKELRGTAGAMVVALPQVTPPPALKERVLAAITDRAASRFPESSGRESSWMYWVPWALAACFAILCVVLVSLGHSFRQRAVQLQQELGERNQEAQELRQQVVELENSTNQSITNYQTRIAEIQRQILQRVEEINRQNAALTNQLQQQHAETRRKLAFAQNEADTLKREKKILEDALGTTVPDQASLSNVRLAVLRPTPVGPSNAIGASAWSPQDQKGQLAIENLPALPPTQSYQFWLIDPKLATPVSGGVLPPDASGSVRIQFAPEVRVESAERFAVSIEPRGGSRTPSARIILASGN